MLSQIKLTKHFTQCVLTHVTKSNLKHMSLLFTLFGSIWLWIRWFVSHVKRQPLPRAASPDHQYNNRQTHFPNIPGGYLIRTAAIHPSVGQYLGRIETRTCGKKLRKHAGIAHSLTILIAISFTNSNSNTSVEWRRTTGFIEMRLSERVFLRWIFVLVHQSDVRIAKTHPHTDNVPLTTFDRVACVSACVENVSGRYVVVRMVFDLFSLSRPTEKGARCGWRWTNKWHFSIALNTSLR